jgi:hypothetical protein
MNKQLLLVGLLSLSMGGCVLVIGNTACPVHEFKKESKEVKVAVDQLPAAVKATLQKEAEGSAIADAEKETEDGKTEYEAHATINGKTYVLKVAEDGTLLAKKLKHKEHDEKDEHKDKD